ncbi:MAG: flavin reductase family protein [Bacteroidales bacterium]|nr:flavin reductase family protein [Bacteroidales bacterium]
MITLDAQNIQQQYLHRIMLGSIAPRPIAFASTIDKEGNPNLSPFSFFNAFGVNPGTLVFSPSRKGRDNTTKNTFENLLEVPEVVINVVTYDMVQQMSLASCEYPKGVNEFIKAGFTQLASELIRPFRVKESPVQYECKVRQIIETGDGPGAGNLVICDILLIHISEDVLDEKNEIDQGKIDLIGRMGGDFYVRTNEMARFIVPKPVAKTGIGIDALPEAIKFNAYLSGNDLGQLGNLEKFPEEDELKDFKNNIEIQNLYQKKPQVFFELIKKTLAENKPFDALCMLVSQL